MPALLTARLILDRLTPDDGNGLFEVRGDPEVMAFWDWPHDASPSVTAAVVEQMLREMASGQACYWTVRLRSDGTFVGLCDLGEMQANQADIGYMLGRRFWGMGLAQEAVACVLEQARALGLTSVRARIHAGNVRSARLLERVGFKEVDSIPDFEIRPGVVRSCKTFALNL
ncbi:MAG TPA: GNAT family N-acetyltransferase [Vicinamibacterales bacterium]